MTKRKSYFTLEYLSPISLRETNFLILYSEVNCLTRVQITTYLISQPLPYYLYVHYRKDSW